MKEGCLTLRRNVSLRVPFIFLPIEKYPLKYVEDVSSAQFVLEGGILKMTGKIDATGRGIRLLACHSCEEGSLNETQATTTMETEDETEAQNVDEKDTQHVDETEGVDETEAQHVGTDQANAKETRMEMEIETQDETEAQAQHELESVMQEMEVKLNALVGSQTAVRAIAALDALIKRMQTIRAALHSELGLCKKWR
jgi:hypothetical protein